MRRYSSNSKGESFGDSTVNQVWSKGKPISGYDSNTWRKDACGATMMRSEYGNTNSTYGWEIDHVKPMAANGGDDLANLQPLQWQNNRHKGDNYPNWTCLVRS